MEGDPLVLDEPQVREAFDEAFDGDLRLELAEARAGAIVDPLAEGEVVMGVRARGSKRSGSGKTRRVAPGCGEPEEELGARREIDAAQRDRARRDAPPHRHRRVVAQRLLDGAGDQRRVGDDRLPARGSSSSRRTRLPIR